MPLAERLYGLTGFRLQLRAMADTLLAEQLKIATSTPRPDFDVGYLLTCASLLAQSENGDCIQAALRIARYALTASGLDEGHRDAAAVVLDTLANQPALRLSEDRGLLPKQFADRLPMPLRFDALRRRMESATMSADRSVVHYFNRFQQQVRDAFSSHAWISISAPTSAGKSFAIHHLLEIALLDNAVNVAACVVPTRALIQQTEADLSTAFDKAGLKDVEIQTMPQLRLGWEMRRTVYVFTQERLHWLLRDAPASFQIELLIVDEAHKLGDGARGVLLDQVLAQAMEHSPRCRVVFSSPLAKNPEILLDLAPAAVSSLPVKSDYAAVTQNLLWVSPVRRKPLEWELEQIVDGKPDSVGRFQLSNRPVPDTKRLPLVAEALGRWEPGNLVYANRASDAEKTATMLTSVCPEPNDFADDPELVALADLAARLVHKKYCLVDTVKRGVACHYGNMPTLLRTEIERLFKDGRLRYLVCTSTLLEGVNLAARSIFMRGPTRGTGRPMNEMDFWNLAGRAGRLGKDFEGNIICVDPRNDKVWKSPPPQTRVRYTLRSSVGHIVEQRTPDLLSYINERAPLKRGLKEPTLDYALIYLTATRFKHATLMASPLARRLAQTALAQVDAALAVALTDVTLPPALLTRHPGISPFAQQRLLDFFKSKTPEQLAALIPVTPESDDAVSAYRPVILAISAHFTGEPVGMWFPRALLVVRWMQGWALARIIAANETYWTKKAKRKKALPQIIRDTMEDVETYARFKFLKYSSCYVEILRWHLKEHRHDHESADNVPDLSLWLEFGASTRTQLSLMSIGLSRTAAIALSELQLDDSMTEDALLPWIQGFAVESLDAPLAVRREIEALQRKHAPRNSTRQQE